DASTFLAPAFFNQTEGLQERVKQFLLNGILPLSVPRRPEQLEAVLLPLGERLIALLAHNPRAVLDPVQERLLALRHNPEANEFRQAETEPVENRPFEGRESRALEAMEAQVRDPNSPFHDAVESIEGNLSIKARGLTESAVAAVQER